MESIIIFIKLLCAHLCSDFHDFISLAATLHDVQTLLQTIGTTTIRIIVFCIGIVADSVEVVNDSSAITLSDAQHGCSCLRCCGWMDVCTHRFYTHALAIFQVRDTPELILADDVVGACKTLIVFATNLGE